MKRMAHLERDERRVVTFVPRKTILGRAGGWIQRIATSLLDAFNCLSPGFRIVLVRPNAAKNRESAIESQQDFRGGSLSDWTSVTRRAYDSCSILTRTACIAHSEVLSKARTTDARLDALWSNFQNSRVVRSSHAGDTRIAILAPLRIGCVQSLDDDLAIEGLDSTQLARLGAGQANFRNERIPLNTSRSQMRTHPQEPQPAAH